MNELFYTVLNMSISSSIMIIGVIILRFICRKLPKRWTIFLWLIVAFRLICPISFSSEVSIFQYTTVVQGQVQHVSNSTNAIVSQFMGDSSVTLAKSAQDYMKFILANAHVIWISICVILMLRMIYKYVKLHVLLKQRVQISDHVYIHDDIDSPFVFGFIKPIIYIPTKLDDKRKNAILLHEQAHIDRKDNLWKALSYLLACVYWFNPLIWIGFSFLSLDLEMACDEKATNSMNPKEKADYSEALLSMVYKSNDYIPVMAFGQLGIKQRIQHLLQQHKQPVWIIVLIVFVLGISCFTLMSNPKAPLIKENTFAQELHDKRTAYIGDAPKVRAIIDALPVPDGLGIDGIQLNTQNEPYGIIIQYSGIPTNRSKMNETFIKNASLLFPLIETLDSVSFLHDELFQQTYTLQDIQNFYPGDYSNLHDSYENFEKLYETSMINQSVFQDVANYAADISMEEAEKQGFYILSVDGERNAAVAESFLKDAKAGLDTSMTFILYTTEGDPIITRVQHDKTGYRCIRDATRDKFGNQIFSSYNFPYMVPIETTEGIDVYLTSEADLNQERIDRANENGEYLNYLYLYTDMK